MNIPEMAKRIGEIQEQEGIDPDPFPKFDQPPPPASVGEAVAAADAAAEAEKPTEEVKPDAEQEAAPEGTTPEEAEQPEGEPAPAPAEPAAEVEDDIAWVKANKGLDVTDPVVAKTLRNQEEMIRRQGTEVGEARKLIEQERQEREAFQAQMEQRLEQNFEPDEAWEEWADEGVSIDPLATIIEAGNAGGPAAARYALSRWHLADPAAATAFQVEAATQQAQAPQVDAEGAWDRVGSRHPDLLDYKAAMTELLEDPETLDRMNALASVDPDAALENLYLRARVGQTDKQRSDALAKANAARAEQEDAAARDATVASATASAGHGETRPLTAAEQVRANVRAELGLVIPE